MSVKYNSPALVKRAQRQRRRRIVLTIFTSIALGILAILGTAVGRGVGLLAGVAREYLPSDPPQLANTKAEPPTPVDISGPATACPASSLAVKVEPNLTEVFREKPVNFLVTVTHTGRYPCLVNGADSNLRLRISDEEGQVLWSTEHCPAVAHRVVNAQVSYYNDLLLGPGNSFSWELRWNGRASAPEKCTDGQRWVSPGQLAAVASLVEVAASDSEPAIVTIAQPLPKFVPPPVEPIGPEMPEDLLADPNRDPADLGMTEPETPLPIEGTPEEVPTVTPDPVD